MQRSDFSYFLPPGLIAQQPAQQRSGSRLLGLDGATGEVSDRLFTDLPDLLEPGDLLIFNDTRVIPARLTGHKASGGKVEVLVERLTGEHSVLAQGRASKAPVAGGRLHLEGALEVQVTGREDSFFCLEFQSDTPVIELLERYGHTPLPPYIERPDDNQDQQRYQTLFARVPGAVAAPTAGLHFDEALLDRLERKGVQRTFITLHVGAGTFQPLRVERLEDHRMHAEHVSVGEDVVEQIRQTRARGGRVIAVGTTVVRSLEAASQTGALQAWSGETRLFITPGYRFHAIDALITNFHLPESTLLMLVCAFGGYDAVMRAYRHAVAEKYRFFSYGDAMFVLPQAGATAQTGEV